MDGQYIRSMDRQLISEEEPFLWLSRGDLEGETKSEIAAQGQALQSTCHMTELLRTETHSTIRLCKQFHEKVEHIISACPILAQEQYREKHDSVCV